MYVGFPGDKNIESDEDDTESVAESTSEAQVNDIIIDDSMIISFENERKNLANKCSFPISTNIDSWKSLQPYRFHMMKDKNVNIFEKWPLYDHSDGACLVIT